MGDLKQNVQSNKTKVPMLFKIFLKFIIWVVKKCTSF